MQIYTISFSARRKTDHQQPLPWRASCLTTGIHELYAFKVGLEVLEEREVKLPRKTKQSNLSYMSNLRGWKLKYVELCRMICSHPYPWFASLPH